MQVRVCDRNEYTMYERDTLYLHYDNWDDYHFRHHSMRGMSMEIGKSMLLAL